MRFPAPFYRKSKKAWYVQFGKSQKSLGPDKADAFRQYADLLAEQQEEQERMPTDKHRSKVWQCFEAFLEHSQQNHAERGYLFYKATLKDAAKSFGTVRVGDLRVHHVTKWLSGKTLSDTTKAHYITMVKMALNFCVKQGYLKDNPIKHMEKPTCANRDRLISLQERDLILAVVKDEAFRDLLTVLYESGARPSEIAMLKAENIDIDAGVVIWFTHKTARKTKKPRIIYMSPLMKEVIERRLPQTKEGEYLFVGREGNPWNRCSFYARFQYLREQHPELKGIVPYSFRTTFATDALEKGVSDAAVAELLGHSGTAMLHKHYNQLSKKSEHLKAMVLKARQGA